MNGQHPGFLPTLHSDFVIIGAGAIGLSSAFELAERGARVTVLERGQVGRESSWAGGGILSPLLPWFYGAEVNDLSEYSRAVLPEWCRHLQALSGVDPEYLETGLLVLPPFQHDQAADWCERHGWRWDVRPERDFLERGGDEAALWLPDVAQVRNPRLVQALRGAAAARGVRIVESAEVTGFETQGGRVITLATSQGEFGADAFVVAAGAWSGALPGLDLLRQRIYPVRGQMLLFQLPPGALSTVIYQDGRYLIPRRDGHVLVGSTLEQVGFDKSTTEEAKRDLLALAASLLPGASELVLARHWSGLRPGSPDNVPVIGRYPGYDNLFVNSGHFRYGVTMAPGAARLLASLIHGEVPPLPVEAYQLPARAGEAGVHP